MSQNFKLITTNFENIKPFQIPYLRVYLDDGSTGAVIQTVQDWSDLKKELDQTNLSISKIKLLFMSNEYTFPIEDADGYFFKMGYCGSYPSDGNESLYFLIGYIHGNCVVSEAWYVPSITFYKNNTRYIDKGNSDYSLIIWKKSHHSNNNVIEGEENVESSHGRKNSECKAAS